MFYTLMLFLTCWIFAQFAILW